MGNARIVILFSLLGLNACSEKNTASENGDGDGDTTMDVVIPTEGPVGAEELPVYLAQIACDQFEECGCPLNVDLAACRMGFASEFRSFSIVLPMYSAEYDPAAGRACLDAALASGCDDAFWLSACEDTIVGLADIGESCVFQIECVGVLDGASHCGEEGLCVSGPHSNFGVEEDAVPVCSL